MNNKNQLYRIIDANFNRAKEGLRVCEDITRYVGNQKVLTKAFKDLRHDLTQVMVGVERHKLLEGRHVAGDIGRPSTASEMKRSDVEDVFFANIQRVKESLRVLEEILKLFSSKISEDIKTLRYKSYVLEQKVFKKR